LILAKLFLDPTLVSMNPRNGLAGMNVAIEGWDFGADQSKIQLAWNGGQYPVVLSVPNTVVSFIVPTMATTTVVVGITVDGVAQGNTLYVLKDDGRRN
jgi:hypothetical protein